MLMARKYLTTTLTACNGLKIANMSKKIISKDNYDMDGRLISKSTYLVDEESEVTTEVTNGYQKLFDYMQDEHGVTLLVTDMDEIIRIVHGMQPTKPEPSRLEVAKEILLNMMNARTYAMNQAGTMVEFAYQCADELIKQSKQTP